MILTDFEREVLGKLSKEKCWEHVEWFTGAGEKLSGTPVNEKTVDYILAALKNYRVEAEAPVFQAWMGFPDLFDAEVKILEPEERALNCIALAQCASASAAGDLIYVGGGGQRDYEGVNARNKVVLVDFSKPPARPWKNYIAGVMKGSLGLIMISHAGPKKALNRGTVKSVWGNPIPDNVDDIGRIPAVNISREDGEYLLRLLENGPVRVRMKAGGLRGFYRTRMPRARVGVDKPEFVLLGSHMDAWGAAGSCNALGCASTLEAARLMSRFSGKLRRGLELVWFQGHETGIMSGSTWYLDNHWASLNPGCVAYLNNDTTNMIHSTIYTVDGDPVLRDFLISTVRELAELERAPFKMPGPKYQPNKIGDQSFLGIGVPSVRVHMTFPPEALSEVGAGGGWWYHSEYDTLDKCDPETMYMAEKAQTLVITRLCTLPVLPYKIVALADWMIDSLAELEGLARGSINLDEVEGKAITFKEKASLLDERTGKIAEAYDEGVRGLKEDVETVNRCLMKISRILNPVNYTLRGKYDQDYYGAEYIKPIPILRPVEELAKLNPDATEYKTLETKLVRARNQVGDAIEDATWLADYLLEVTNA
jgi:Iap family predicted aminopeptidase